MSAVNPRSPVSGFRVVRELSASSGTRVCLCVDERNAGRRVVLKIAPEALGEALAAHALRTHRQLMRLDQPNLVRVYECGLLGEDDDGAAPDDEQHSPQEPAGAYVAMEFVDGDELEEQVFDGMSSGAALEVLIAMAQALAAAHETGLVHGSISPSHVLFRGTDTPVLIGFGSAEGLRGASAAHRRYRSPELRAGGAPDRACDIYSLGVCFYDMLTGAEADEDENAEHWPPALPSELAVFAPLVDAMTAANPDDRPGNAELIAELAVELRDVATAAPLAGVSRAGDSTAPELRSPNATSVFEEDTSVRLVPPDDADAEDLSSALARDFAHSSFVAGDQQDLEPDTESWFAPEEPPAQTGAVDRRLPDTEAIDVDLSELETSSVRASVTEVDFDVGTAAPDVETSGATSVDATGTTLDIDLSAFANDKPSTVKLDVDFGQAFSEPDDLHADSTQIDLADLDTNVPPTDVALDRVATGGTRSGTGSRTAGTDATGDSSASRDLGRLGTGTISVDELDAEIARATAAGDATLPGANLPGTNPPAVNLSEIDSPSEPYWSEEEHDTTELALEPSTARAASRVRSTQDWFSRLTIGGLVVLLLGFGWAAYKGLEQGRQGPARQAHPGSTAEPQRLDGSATSPARAFAGGADADTAVEQGAAAGTVVGAGDAAPDATAAVQPAPEQPAARPSVAAPGAVVVPPTQVQPLAPVETAAVPALPVSNEAAPATAQPVPQQTAPPVAATDTPDVQRLLDLGRQRLAENKLTTPEQQSAYRYYREAVALQPDSPGAQALRRDIATRYVTLAAARWERAEHSAARSLARRGLNVDPDNAALAEILRRPLPGEEGSSSGGTTASAPSRATGNSPSSQPGFGSSLRRYLDRFQPVPAGQRAVPRDER